MTIGEAAERAGVSAKRIRHYEAAGLLGRAQRSYAGYRLYNEADVERVRFIGRARHVGFSIPQIRHLLSLWDDRSRPAQDVRRLALAHWHALDTQISELQTLADTLARLIEHCQGDERPDCPILAALAGGDPILSGTTPVGGPPRPAMDNPPERSRNLRPEPLE